MDIKAYIESGVVESYVLGLASSDEIAEVEMLRIKYGEVEKAINEFSLSLENEALAEAVTPPAYVKDNIIRALQSEFIQTPVISISASQNVKQEQYKNLRKNIFPWKMMAAASVILLLVSAALNFYFYHQYAEKKEAYTALLNERNSLQASNQVFQASQVELQSMTKMMADPAIKMIQMKSPAGKNLKAAAIFWDSRSKDVFVMAKELPHPQVGKQMQLWAIVDGKPVDAGMIDPLCAGICKMKSISKAQAFAITMENEGGSPAPHLDQLLVIGNI